MARYTVIVRMVRNVFDVPQLSEIIDYETGSNNNFKKTRLKLG